MVDVQIRALQQGVDDFPGLTGVLDPDLGDLEGLPAADHHIALPQGNEVAFQALQFLAAGLDLDVELGELSAVPLQVGILGRDVAAEAIAFNFQLPALLHQRGQFLLESAGLLSDHLQLALGFAALLFGTAQGTAALG